MSGWIKIHRVLRNHWVFDNPDHFKAWITILMEVNHTAVKTAIGSKLFVCGRGESLKSLDSWSCLFGKKWNKSKVRRFFKLLEQDDMIITKNETKTTRLIVCNYSEYQSERNANETQVKRKRNASETQVTPNKNVKNVKKDKRLVQNENNFALFWDQYPNKKNKKKAKQTWMSRKLGNGLFETVMASLGAFKESDEWTKDGGKFIPMPTTWLNGDRWEDEGCVESKDCKLCDYRARGDCHGGKLDCTSFVNSTK